MIVDRFCASSGQQRLWFLDQFEPGKGLYNIPLVWQIEGELQPAALQQSLLALIERHEILRTTFSVDEVADASDSPARSNQIVEQLIADTMPVTLDLCDLSSLAADNHPQLLQQHARTEASFAFDLSKGPLLRAKLLKFAPQQHVLLLTMHHIISDAWSLAIFAKEWGQLYDAYLQGQAPQLTQLPPLALQYADYAVWQHETMQSGGLQSQLQYWRQQLQDMPRHLALATDFPRPNQRTQRGEVVEFTLSQEVTAGLRQLSQKHNATLFMTLAAAFNVLLYRYSEQQDIALGYPIANRNRLELQSLIGFFVNTLVLRTRLQPEQSFSSLLQHVKGNVLDADEHQDLPYEMLVDALRPSSQELANGTGAQQLASLFQVSFSLQNANQAEQSFNLRGTQIRHLPAPRETAKFDLFLELADRGCEIVGAFEYDADLFLPSTIARMNDHWQTLLAAIIATPECALQDLPLHDRQQEAHQLRQWNDTAQAFATDLCIHQWIEQQVQATPDAVALVYQAQQLSYRQLNAQANQLAHTLLQAGVGADHLVALCVERGVEMIVCALAILKAGAAYLPLDPEYPDQRLHYVLQDSAATLLLTQSQLQPRFAALSTRLLCLDLEQAQVASMPSHNPAVHLSPQRLAYCIYTSGSTGKPKGVMIEHRSLVASTHARQLAYGDTGPFLLISPIGFDSSVAGIFGTLCHGNTLHIAATDSLRHPEQLRRDISRFAIRSLLCVPSLYRALLECGVQEGAAPQRVILAGEAIPPNLQQISAQIWPNTQISNEYGPTETTVWASVYHLPAEAAVSPLGPVPIGQPIANARIYILDQALQAVPRGWVGEICIGGIGVARGYLHRPELTAEKFVPDPFGAPGSRLYRSGDLGRIRSDGQLEFLGRIDHQIKIRGFRIEPGEIEAALLLIPGIKATVVTDWADSEGSKHLVAYLVASEAGTLDAHAVRAQLRASLPTHMLPSYIVTLAHLPLNSHGKIDRAALPAPTLQESQATAEFVAPHTASEILIAGIWAELLKLPRVGAQDNFFDLGGNSILTTRVMARIARSTRIKMPTITLFQQPTLAALARQLDTLQAQKAQADSQLLSNIMGQVGQMSDAEVRALLEQKMRQKMAQKTPPNAQ